MEPFEITLNESAFSNFEEPYKITSTPVKTNEGFSYTVEPESSSIIRSGYSHVQETNVEFDMSTETTEAYDLDAIKKYFTEKYSKSIIAAANSKANKEAAFKKSVEKRRARNKFKKTTRKK